MPSLARIISLRIRFGFAGRDGTNAGDPLSVSSDTDEFAALDIVEDVIEVLLRL